MRRLQLVPVLIVMLGAAGTAQAETRLDRPVVLLAGAEMNEGAGVDCDRLWGPLQEQIEGLEVGSGSDKPRRFSGEVVKATLFGGDRGCQTIGDGGGLGVEGQARLLAEWLRRTYSAKGQAVDVIAGGTSGVVLRYALGRAADDSDKWPRPLLVEDAVTLGSPHAGSEAIATACRSRPVCRDMDPAAGSNDELFHELQEGDLQNPQGKGGTDWTLIGSDGDELVPMGSATAMAAAHTAQYQEKGLSHDELLSDGSQKSDLEAFVVNVTTGIKETEAALHSVKRSALAAIHNLARQPEILTTKRLRELAKKTSWGKPSTGIRFNRATGRSIQEAMLRIIGLPENGKPYFSPKRRELTEKRVTTVVPDAVTSLDGVVWDEPLAPPRPVFFPESSWYEIKAESRTLRPRKRDHQLHGMIDAVARSPAGKAPEAQRAFPILTLIATKPTSGDTFNDQIFDIAFKRKVAIWYAPPYELRGYEKEPSMIGLFPLISANPEVYGDRAFTFAKNFTARTQLSAPGTPAPVCDPDPPEVDSLEGEADDKC